MSILSTIDFLGFATRTQVKEIHSLSSVRNANRVLSNMYQYLHHLRVDGEGERVYYLNQAGRDLIGSEKEMRKSLQITHHLMRNDMYVYLGCPENWKIEDSFNFSSKVDIGAGILSNKEMTLIPDAKCTINHIRHYIEVDNTQQMKENKKKIETYALLRDAYKALNKTMFHLVFYTSSDIRQTKLKKWCHAAELNASVYTKKDII
jgi:hypothetical protein